MERPSNPGIPATKPLHFFLPFSKDRSVSRFMPNPLSFTDMSSGRTRPLGWWFIFFFVVLLDVFQSRSTIARTMIPLPQTALPHLKANVFILPTSNVISVPSSRSWPDLSVPTFSGFPPSKTIPLTGRRGPRFSLRLSRPLVCLQPPLISFYLEKLFLVWTQTFYRQKTLLFPSSAMLGFLLFFSRHFSVFPFVPSTG